MKLFILANSSLSPADWGAYSRKMINHFPKTESFNNWNNFHKHILISDGGNKFIMKKNFDIFQSLTNYASYYYNEEIPQEQQATTPSLAVIGIILPIQVYSLFKDLQKDEFHNFTLSANVNGSQELTTIANGRTTSVKQVPSDEIKLVQTLMTHFK